MAQGKNKSTADNLSEGSSMEESTPLVGGSGNGIDSAAKMYPTYGTSDKSTNLKSVDFKRVSSGY